MKVIFLDKKSSSPAPQALPNITRASIQKRRLTTELTTGNPTSETDLADRENKQGEELSQSSFINQTLAKSQRKISSLSPLPPPLPKLWEIGYIFQRQVLTVLYCLKKWGAGIEGGLGRCREASSVTHCSAKKVEEGQRCVVLQSRGQADASLPQKLIYHLDGFSSFAAKLLSPLK